MFSLNLEPSFFVKGTILVPDDETSHDFAFMNEQRRILDIAGQIKNGVSIAGGLGTVINHGTIGSAGSEYSYYGYPIQKNQSSNSPSVKLTAGGALSVGGMMT